MIEPLRNLDDYEHDSAIYLKAWLILVRAKEKYDCGENKLNKRVYLVKEESSIIIFYSKAEFTCP